VEQIVAAMVDAGIAAVAEPDIRTNAWEKLVRAACFFFLYCLEFTVLWHVAGMDRSAWPAQDLSVD
jgi:hypothetical protein